MNDNKEKTEATVINLMKGTLSFIAKNGDYITIPSSGEAKVDIIRVDGDTTANIQGLEIKTNKTIVGKITGLPPYNKDYIYIVPTLVYQSIHHERPDVYIVDELIRDHGTVKVAKAISRPEFKSVLSDFEKINNILVSIDFDNSSSIINSVFEAKTITDKYIK